MKKLFFIYKYDRVKRVSSMNLIVGNHYCQVKFNQAVFKEPPSCPADILPPKGEGFKCLINKILAPTGGKWRISAERGHEINV